MSHCGQSSRHGGVSQAGYALAGDRLCTLPGRDLMPQSRYFENPYATAFTQEFEVGFLAYVFQWMKVIAPLLVEPDQKCRFVGMADDAFPEGRHRA